MEVYDVIFEIRQALNMKCSAELKIAIIEEIMDDYIEDLIKIEEDDQ